MNFGLTQSTSLPESDCLVLGLCGDSDFQDYALSMDKHLQGLINRLFNKLNEKGDWLWQSEVNNRSLMVVHCGNKDDFDVSQLRKRLGDITAALLKHRCASATLSLPSVKNKTADWQVTQIITQIDALSYQSLEFKTKNNKPKTLESVQFFMPGASQDAVALGQAIAEGIELTRTLADLPANRCTPTYLGEQALALTQQIPAIHTTIFGPEDKRTMNMGALLAVAQGSIEEPRLIEMQYRGGGNSAPLVLVGKGITFDSGGLTLKPGDGMMEMKYDMSGAASVLGTMKACALLKLPVNLIGLVASAENMPSGTAVKPGDIVTSMSGQTIEILNTDAEGRLVLADALTYAERFNPAMVLDIATLTGAMIVALGFVTTGFMTKDDEMANFLMAASANSDDPAWRMPLDEAYQEALDSPMADMINASFDRSAGAITAACFLSRFTKKYRWTHLDIAGTAWVSGKKRQATGRPVQLLVEFIRHVINSR